MIRVLIVVLITAGADAQSVDPVWIVKDEGPAPVEFSAAGAVFRFAATTAALLGVGVLLTRRRREMDVREAAYDHVAQRLGLDADDRAIIREIGAQAQGVAPVALLMSDSALQRELTRMRRKTLDPGARARLNRIEAKVLG